MVEQSLDMFQRVVGAAGACQDSASSRLMASLLLIGRIKKWSELLEGEEYRREKVRIRVKIVCVV